MRTKVNLWSQPDRVHETEKVEQYLSLIIKNQFKFHIEVNDRPCHSFSAEPNQTKRDAYSIQIIWPEMHAVVIKFVLDVVRNFYFGNLILMHTLIVIVSLDVIKPDTRSSQTLQRPPPPLSKGISVLKHRKI